MGTGPSATLDYLRKVCSTREYCRKDIYAKALARGCSPEEARRLITALEDDGYLDERRYAGAFARDRSFIAGWGPLKIRFALVSKGVEKSVIEEALSGIDAVGKTEVLKKLLLNKKKMLEGDPQIRIKMLKFALSRGYLYENVADVMDEIFKIVNYEEIQ